MRATRYFIRLWRWQILRLWNQKGTDAGSLLFARMAASYIRLHEVLLQTDPY